VPVTVGEVVQRDAPILNQRDRIVEPYSTVAIKAQIGES